MKHLPSITTLPLPLNASLCCVHDGMAIGGELGHFGYGGGRPVPIHRCRTWALITGLIAGSIAGPKQLLRSGWCAHRPPI